MLEAKKASYRSVFISDVHLGTRNAQADELCDFLKNHTCERLYLVGDIFDFWHMERGKVYWHQSHSNVLESILSASKRTNHREWNWTFFVSLTTLPSSNSIKPNTLLRKKTASCTIY